MTSKVDSKQFPFEWWDIPQKPNASFMEKYSNCLYQEALMLRMPCTSYCKKAWSVQWPSQAKHPMSSEFQEPCIKTCELAKTLQRFPD